MTNVSVGVCKKLSGKEERSFCSTGTCSRRENVRQGVRVGAHPEAEVRTRRDMIAVYLLSGWRLSATYFNHRCASRGANRQNWLRKEGHRGSFLWSIKWDSSATSVDSGDNRGRRFAFFAKQQFFSDNTKHRAVSLRNELYIQIKT